jgi:hypothetical protein
VASLTAIFRQKSHLEKKAGVAKKRLIIVAKNRLEIVYI